MKRYLTCAVLALLLATPAAAQDTVRVAGADGVSLLVVYPAGGVDTVLVPPDTVVLPPDTVEVCPVGWTCTPPDSPPDTTTPPTPPGGTGAIYFATDWSGATGRSVGAILDGGRWSGGAGNWRNSFEVVPAPDGFPTDFVLEQRGIAESGSWVQIELYCGSSYGAPCDAALAAVPELQDGDSLGMRVYWQSPNPYGNVDNLLHGFEVLDPGNDPIGINSRYEGGGWQIEIDIPSAEVYGPRGPSGMGAFDLTPNGVYMLEVLAVRVATNQIHVAARLTDAATGNVIRGEYDWESYYDPNARPLHEDSPFTTTSNSWQHLREWRMGINGIGNVGGEVVHRWGGFALCSSWCGPYPIPGHEGS